MIFSTSGTCVITAANTKPIDAPMANPLKSSMSVICICGQKRSGKRVTNVVTMALGGVIPFLSFIIERRVELQVRGDAAQAEVAA